MQLDQIINVASVPQRSPFRYPGGKTWLIPYIRQWLSSQLGERAPIQPELLVEPFAGGGIVSLTATAEHLVQHAIMVELDRAVASVWQTIIHSADWSWLTDQIVSFELTYENVLAYLAIPLTRLQAKKRPSEQS